MPDAVLILEDDAERVDRMRPWVQRLLPGAECCVFDRAAAAIVWVAERQADAVLISLDHDLPLRHDAEGRPDDLGTGRQVSDLLGRRTPTCPVIVHTSNGPAGDGMEWSLRRSGWPAWRVPAMGDLAWIDYAWGPTLARLIVWGWIQRPRCWGVPPESSS